MKRNIILTFTLLVATLIFAQPDKDTKAKLYFAKAEKTYKQGDFDTSLGYIKKTENTLGGTVARTLALRIKILYAQGKFIEAKKAIDNYTANFTQSASQELNDEVLSLYVDIEEAANKIEKEKEKARKELEQSDIELTNLSIEDIKKDLIGHKTTEQAYVHHYNIWGEAIYYYRSWKFEYLSEYIDVRILHKIIFTDTYGWKIEMEFLLKDSDSSRMYLHAYVYYTYKNGNKEVDKIQLLKYEETTKTSL